ncbi:Iron-containing redox enzyme [Rhabdaerophilaceae bacterium]
MAGEAEAMRDFVDRWRDIAIVEESHQSRIVSGKDVSWWLSKANATTEDFMRALSGDPNLVIPGQPEASRFLTSFLKQTRPMGSRLSADRPIVENWISAGAPIPEAVNPVALDLKANLKRKTVPFSGSISADEVLINEPVYFHQLINIEDYSDFLPDAKRLAEYYLEQGSKQSLKDSEYEPLDDFTTYDENEFDSRMKAIYDNLLKSMYDPHWFDSGILNFPDQSGIQKRYDIGRVTDACPRERMLQAAPFNLVDGAWLQNIITVGPTNKVQSNLFAIWDDEAGNGIVSQNHPNVYDSLLKSQNIYLPPITTKEFIEQDFLAGAFTSPTFQLAIGNFPQAFFPELLGMTLYLEWEATPTLTSTVRMLAGRGINPLFYSLHVAIDNISEGHGALAKESVKLYLQNIREEGGEKAVQEHWKRIRNGYITWLTIGGIGRDLIERFLIIERKQINISADPIKKVCWPDFKAYYRQKMIKLVERKAPFARDVHRGNSIGGQSLADLFDNPKALLDSFVRYDYIDPERPRDSRLLKLMDFNGPMYKVFTEHDKTIILDWIESLRPTSQACIDPLPDVPVPTDLPEQVAKMIDDRSVDAMGAHNGIMVTDATGRKVALNTLFGNSSELIHLIIANGWIVPGDPNRSVLLTRIMRNGGPMDRVFSDAEEEIIRAWIAAGAHAPNEGPKLIETMHSLDGQSADRLRSALDQTIRAIPRRHLIGMGAVH